MKKYLLLLVLCSCCEEPIQNESSKTLRLVNEIERRCKENQEFTRGYYHQLLLNYIKDGDQVIISNKVWTLKLQISYLIVGYTSNKTESGFEYVEPIYNTNAPLETNFWTSRIKD